MKKLSQLFFIIGIILSLLSVPVMSSAQTSTVVKIDPNSVVVDPGDSFSVDVMVENVQDLYAFDIIVQFDPEVIIVNQITLGSFLVEGIILIQEVNNLDGKVQFAMTQVRPEPAKTGTDTLFTIDFSALEVGASDLTISQKDLTEHETYLLIPCDQLNGFVQVGPAKANFDIFIPLFINNNG